MEEIHITLVRLVNEYENFNWRLLVNGALEARKRGFKNLVFGNLVFPNLTLTRVDVRENLTRGLLVFCTFNTL